MFTLSWSLLIKICPGRGRGVLPYISHIGMCRTKGKVFAPFLSENGYTLYSFWFGFGYGFRRNFRPVGTYLSFQCQISKAGTKS